MEKKDIKDILNKIEAGSFNEREEQMAKLWLFQLHNENRAELSAQRIEEADAHIWQRLQKPVRTSAVKTKLWLRMVGVAAAVAAIMIGVLFYRNEVASSRKRPFNDEWVKNDIGPGKMGATLTLGNGKIIQLSEAKSGVVIGNDLKYSDGEILRDALDDKGGVLSSLGLSELVASTTKGQTYEFTLPDGTRVWLNSDSKISFSSRFSDQLRRVRLEGEAFFKVAKDKSRPFIVEGRGQQVKVLGTEFNVNSYTDEPFIATTLVEGSVEVKTGTRLQRIEPGEQLSNNGSEFKVTKVNVDNVMDWKNGEFNLQGLPFRVAMRKIARWYNVELVYDSSVPDDMVSGGWISRDTKLSTILEVIERSKLVRFKVENKKIFITGS